MDGVTLVAIGWSIVAAMDGIFIVLVRGRESDAADWAGRAKSLGSPATI
jgi:hypothetical protein